MESASTTSIKVARTGLAAIFAWNVVRAVTQTVTPGEAWNYDRYIGPGWTDAFRQYDSNNHVLNTLLVRMSTARIHLTEFSLRMPSLLCGALYLWAVYRIARRCFRSSAMFLTVAGLLVLNPLVLDAMSEARGYGMALAAWLWALELLLEALESLSTAKLNLAGVLLGLSVAASLAFAAPSVALILAAAAVRRGALAKLPHLAFLTAFMLLVLPLNHAEITVVTEGAANLRQTLNHLIAGSFGEWSVTGRAAARIAAAVLMASVAVAGLAAWYRKEQGRLTLLMCLAGGTLAFTVLLVLAASYFVRAAFPEEGAIYVVPILTLAVASMVARTGRKPAEIAFLVVAGVCTAAYAGQLRLPYRAGLPYTGGRELAKILRAGAIGRGVRVGVSEQAEGILRYYRWRYRQPNWEPIERIKPDAGFDYYVLTTSDAEEVPRRGLTVLYRDSGLILAK